MTNPATISEAELESVLQQMAEKLSDAWLVGSFWGRTRRRVGRGWELIGPVWGNDDCWDGL
jgi:hypothetical protein